MYVSHDFVDDNECATYDPATGEFCLAPDDFEAPRMRGARTARPTLTEPVRKMNEAYRAFGIKSPETIGLPFVG